MFTAQHTALLAWADRVEARLGERGGGPAQLLARLQDTTAHQLQAKQGELDWLNKLRDQIAATGSNDQEQVGRF